MSDLDRTPNSAPDSPKAGINYTRVINAGGFASVLTGYAANWAGRKATKNRRRNVDKLIKMLEPDSAVEIEVRIPFFLVDAKTNDLADEAKETVERLVLKKVDKNPADYLTKNYIENCRVNIEEYLLNKKELQNDRHRGMAYMLDHSVSPYDPLPAGHPLADIKTVRQEIAGLAEGHPDKFSLMRTLRDWDGCPSRIIAYEGRLARFPQIEEEVAQLQKWRKWPARLKYGGGILMGLGFVALAYNFWYGAQKLAVNYKREGGIGEQTKKATGEFVISSLAAGAPFLGGIATSLVLSAAAEKWVPEAQKQWDLYCDGRKSGWKTLGDGFSNPFGQRIVSV
jgi:hypothetical protein